LSLRRAGRFKPTDLSRLPNGDLLLLERSFTRLLGPAARISRIPRGALEAGGEVVPQQLAILSLPLSVDNSEGLATVPAPGGGQWIYVLSDDNFNHMLQRTLLLKFLWPDG